MGWAPLLLIVAVVAFVVATVLVAVGETHTGIVAFGVGAASYAASAYPPGRAP